MGHYDEYYQRHDCPRCNTKNLHYFDTEWVSKYDFRINNEFKKYECMRICKKCYNELKQVS